MASTQFERPDPEALAALGELGVDTVTSTMDSLGVRRTIMEGLIARVPGSRICGPALTLRFVPQREDQMDEFRLPGVDDAAGTVEGEEVAERRSALWQVFDLVQPGDVIAVDGRGDLATGCFGEMLMTFFQAQGGAGVVIDAGIRDSAQIFQDLRVPVWSVAVTTGGARHMNLMPADVNLSVGCGRVLVNPGDVVMADDGGAIVVPPRLIPHILEHGGDRDAKEVFIRERLQAGGELSKYYPLSAEGLVEYEQWRTREGQA